LRLKGGPSHDTEAPWGTLEYTSDVGHTEVPCRAICAVTLKDNSRHFRFEIEYVEPELQRRQRTKIKLQAVSQEQFSRWREALAPLPLPFGETPMDRARAWLSTRIREIPLNGSGGSSEDEQEQDSARRSAGGIAVQDSISPAAMADAGLGGSPKSSPAKPPTNGPRASPSLVNALVRRNTYSP